MIGAVAKVKSATALLRWRKFRGNDSFPPCCGKSWHKICKIEQHNKASAEKGARRGGSIRLFLELSRKFFEQLRFRTVLLNLCVQLVDVVRHGDK